MKKVEPEIEADDMRPEYDFSQLKGRVRGKYVERYRKGTNLVLLAPDVAEAFPDADAVNDSSIRASNNKPRISTNSVSLAGEFAVLSRLALWGYDASMTLGRTKNVDVLVSNPITNELYQLEVKTNLNTRKRPPVSKLFGRYLSDWIMNEKHESISRANLWYCFVTIDLEPKTARYFIVPSPIVAKYVYEEHRLWLTETPKVKENSMRLFRIGFKDERYRIPTPTVEQYEDNWEFKL